MGLGWVRKPGLTARQLLLLLLLAASLVGLLLLLEFIVSQTSTGPRELMAGPSSADETLGVPSGAELLKYLILALSIILAVAALVAPLGWPLRRAAFQRWWALLAGVIVAATLALAGGYLVFSGMLDDLVPYDEHLVRLSHVETESLLVLAAIFLSITIAGLVHWRLLVAALVVWIAAVGGFGLLDTEPIDGLRLFPAREIDSLPGSFGEEVRSIQQGEAEDVARLMRSEVTALQTAPPSNAPVFRVSGATHTRYLRTSTGDIYEGGIWSAESGPSVSLEPNAPVADALGSLVQDLPWPTAAPRRELSDEIVITPSPGVELLPDGVLPLAQHLRRVDVSMNYFPFSDTLASDVELPSYAMEVTLQSFALSQRINASPVADQAWLQLPATLPRRVRNLAEQITGGESAPYLKARLLQAYLQEEHGYATAESEWEASAAEGRDPVDWFLFEHRIGTAGNFSSAFVVLARAAGVPARAVSGWLIMEQGETQTVYAQQAHQWAEIALDGLGWVTLDPFPRDARSDADIDHAWLITMEDLAASASSAVRNAVPALRDGAENAGALLKLFEVVDAVEDPAVRLAARLALGALNLDRFTALLVEDGSPELRMVAAYGLGVIADPESQDVLIQVLAADEHAGVRESAAEALAFLGKDGAEETLLLALDADPAAAVREASALTLGTLQTESTAARMIPALDADSSAAVRAAVAWALGEIQHDPALPVLLNARREDGSATVRDAAAEAISEWEFGDLVAILEGAVEPDLRAAAAQVLGESNLEEAIVPLGKALNDSEQKVREMVLAALEAIGKVTWLESGGGVLEYEGDLAFLPDVTADSRKIAPVEPVFRVRGSSHTSLLRVAVGDTYREARWTATEQEDRDAGMTGIEFRPHDIIPQQSEGVGHQNSIDISGVGLAQSILSGPVPTSLHAQSFANPVRYQVPSHTVIARDTAQYSWDAIAYEYAQQLLHSANLWSLSDDSVLTQLPSDAWVEQARVLAVAITADETSAYGKAKAIEQYLIGEFTYLAPGSSAAASEERDPIAALLFDTREGSAGALSSAFVILARSLSIPARVVSGWAVAEQSGSQVVFADQAHQWAEVPFERLGWVTFDPAPDGAPSRVPDEIETYERMGAEVTRLESGGALVEQDGRTFIMPGSTAQPVAAGPHVALYEVSGARNVGYLRVSVGDQYEDGVWSQLDPVSIEYKAGSYVQSTLRSLYEELKSQANTPFADRLSSPSLFGLRENSPRADSVLIKMSTADGMDQLPSGAMPSSLNLQSMGLHGTLHPFSGMFVSEGGSSQYSWSAKLPSYSTSDLNRAAAVTDADSYTQLPADLPDGVQQLAEQITAGQGSAYAKAVALEQYLRANYSYAADGQDLEAVPAGRDPVDWFLFDAQEGTAGQFSSAFVVMARSIGIPSRVVSGFVISPSPEQQTVHADQAHQWAEVALDGLGWVRFDPTTPGGPASRVPGESPDARGGSGNSDAPGAQPGARPAGSNRRPTDTVTNITEAPEQIRRQAPFLVAGTVQTPSGQDVSGITVEIYVNETKEHGGTKIGKTTSRLGRFEALAELPPHLELGGYQLLARAVGNSQFNESWSDPDIQVFSGSQFELSGPTEADLYAEAEFAGRLTDDTDEALADRVIEVTFSSSTGLVVVTDEEGRFSFSKSFSQLGEHWVEVGFDGEELLLDESARLNFNVVQPTEIAVYAPDAVAQGEALMVTGRVRAVRGPALQEGQVELTLSSAEEVDIVTVEIGDDGRFKHSVPSLDHTGPHTLTGRFTAAEFIRTSVAEVSIQVLRPTVLTLDGPTFVQDGGAVSFTGTLREQDDHPVAGAIVRILGAQPLTRTTDANGQFTGQVEAAFDENAAYDPHESAFRIEAVYEHSTELASSSAAWTVAVGVPRILVEDVESAIRGEETIVRGTVLVGTNRPVSGVDLTLSPEIVVTTNEAGAFTHRLSLSTEEPLGSSELEIVAPDLGIRTTLQFSVKSRSTLIVTPLGDVGPGRIAMLQAALLDDRGVGIAGARLRSSQGVDATTDEFGLATLELEVPESEALAGSRVEFTFAGDDAHAPLSTPYFWEGAITPGGLNWQIVAGAAVLFVLLLAAGYVLRAFMPLRLVGRLRRRPVQHEPMPTAEMVDAIVRDTDAGGTEDNEESDDAEADVGGNVQPPVQLHIGFDKSADDLPDVWGANEDVHINVRVSDDGRPVAGANLAVSVGDSAGFNLTVGEDGLGHFTWSHAEPGEYTVSAEFTGDDGAVVESRVVQIVEFREEIVRLYGVFQDWAKEQDAGVSDESTPREVEMLLATLGFTIPERYLNDVVSRFEEADYSEHEILRRQYEEMYRSLNAVVGADQ